MPPARSLRDVIDNLLQDSDLPFRDYVELALYHPEFGYYSRPRSPVGKEGDYITSPTLSPAFGFALTRLVREFVSRAGGAVCSIVDIGCGDGSLIHSLYAEMEGVRWFGVDRSLERVKPHEAIRFVKTADEIPRDGAHLFLSNELFDAFPFTRLVMRGEHLHELWVTDSGLRAQGSGLRAAAHESPEPRAPSPEPLTWKEYEAAAPYDDYFAARGIALDDGQFADVSLEWEAYYDELASRLERGLLVTFDYGYHEQQLFHPRARRFGTAAAYAQQRVTRDLLATPGEQDLTAHINFTDLERAGERRGLRTLFFERQAKFLLSLGITEHELFAPAQEVPIDSLEHGVAMIDRREEARRLVLPDSLGHDIRVLVQGRGMGEESWSFQRKLW